MQLSTHSAAVGFLGVVSCRTGDIFSLPEHRRAQTSHQRLATRQASGLSTSDTASACTTQVLNTGESQSDLEKTTEKYGLEAGLWQAFRGKGGKGNQGQQAKDLLTRYGGAYLVTSISFAIVSFAACYALVSAGV